MKKLLNKEILLTLHPTAILFWGLSAMMIIPNYPYYVVFFYVGLGIFFTCLNGRENNDVFYTMTLPVEKKDIVKARFILVIALELIQVILCIPFAILRQNIGIGENLAGMDANITLFGLSFVMMGIFNLVFFNIYYKDVKKVGKAFGIASVFVFLYIFIAEVCAHAVPYIREHLDTTDLPDENLIPKIIVLLSGIIIYTALTAFIYKKSVGRFEKLDI